jgi:hypothetical protein
MKLLSEVEAKASFGWAYVRRNCGLDIQIMEKERL